MGWELLMAANRTTGSEEMARLHQEYLATSVAAGDAPEKVDGQVRETTDHSN